MKVYLLFPLLLFFTSPLYAGNCYGGLAGGESFVGISGIERIEDRIFTSGYANGNSAEKKRSTTLEVQIGCVISQRYGLKWELGVLDGFKHSVHTKGTVIFEGYSADFTADRIVRARGYMLSGIFEKQLSSRTHGYVRVGALYVQAMADIHPMSSEFSIHAEKEGLVPLVGLGGRYIIDERWSGRGEYRIIGHKKVTQGLFALQYSF